MKYYVVADVHGYMTELKTALLEKGFFRDKEPHKLIVCGDLMDRGREALAVQSFILDLMEKDGVILIKGNHEELIYELADNFTEWMGPFIKMSHHWGNGTVDTVLQLTGMTLEEAYCRPSECAIKLKNSPFYKKIIPAMTDFYETKRYIFVHGWIPCFVSGYATSPDCVCRYDANWRVRGEESWQEARWCNGMLIFGKGVKEPGKTIVCGHWHCSYGHAELEKKGSEFGNDADFSPFIADGIMAIDACTAYSHKVNCVVIEDELI